MYVSFIFYDNNFIGGFHIRNVNGVIMLFILDIECVNVGKLLSVLSIIFI